MDLKEQQFEYRLQQEISKELPQYVLPFDKDLQKWYAFATQALQFASPVNTNVPQAHFKDLLEITNNEIRLNVVAVLCNLIESLTANQLKVTFHEYLQILELNQMVSDRWAKAVMPIRQTCITRLRLINGNKSMNIVN